MTIIILKRYLAKFICAFIPNKSLRQKIRQKITNRIINITLDKVDSSIPKSIVELINSFNNEDFLALNFAKEQGLEIQEKIQITNNSKTSKPYVIESQKALNLKALLSTPAGGGQFRDKSKQFLHTFWIL